MTLAIESSSPRGSVAICRGEQVLVELTHQRPNAHAEELPALLEAALRSAALERAALGRVVVGVGPGSFTGLRAGIALGQGVALGLGIEGHGVSSLAALAFNARGRAAELYGGLLDARRGEYFFAAYDQDFREVVAPRTIPQAGAQRLIERLLDGRRASIAGEAARGVLPEGWLPPEPECDFPRAAHLVSLLHAGFASAEMMPFYLRDADAKLPDLPPSPLRN